MHSIDLSKRNIGFNFEPGKSPLMTVWAPFAKTMDVHFEGKRIYNMEKTGDGCWQSSCPEAEPGDLYTLSINKKSLYPDPASLSQPDGVHGASQCIDLGRIRQKAETSWRGISMNELIIYELHVGTFTNEGTFRAIHKKLAYLKDLGITAIELMPVAAFPGSRNWGYDGVFPFAVQNSYGGAEELAQLVKACHDFGIAVILDVVYNHLGPEGNYLKYFGTYFSGKYKTPWGNAINFDDDDSKQVRRFFIENALMWLRDFNIDGLRLDAVQTIMDQSPEHFLAELSKMVKQLNKLNGRNHFLIGESDVNDSRYVSRPQNGGFGLDALWCDDYHHALHALLTGERSGYYKDFGSLKQMEKAMRYAFVRDANDPNSRERHNETPARNLPGNKFVVFNQNHDQVGNRLYGNRLSTMLDVESLKLAAGLTIISPYIPMLFM
jgi:maltooligosyltrehalose trehalohydrolase